MSERRLPRGVLEGFTSTHRAKFVLEILEKDENSWNPQNQRK